MKELVIESLPEKKKKKQYYPEKIQSKQYLYWVDLMRSLPIITMVMLHCGVPLYHGVAFLPTWFFHDLVQGVTVSTFTFLAGYTMCIHYPQIDNYKTYTKRKFKYILPNYLLWGTTVRSRHR